MKQQILSHVNVVLSCLSQIIKDIINCTCASAVLHLGPETHPLHCSALSTHAYLFGNRGPVVQDLLSSHFELFVEMSDQSELKAQMRRINGIKLSKVCFIF